MKKISFLMSCAAMLALSFTSCEFNEDNAISQNDYTIDSSGDFKTALAKGGNIVLSEDAVIELNEQVELPSVVIEGSKEKPAIIKLDKEGGFIASGNTFIKNVKIISTSKNPIVQLPQITLAEGQTAVAIDNVVFDNVEVELSSALIKSVCKGVLVNNFNVNNSIVKVNADVTVFDFAKGSGAGNFNISNSTIFAPTATSKSLYSSQGGQKGTELGLESQIFNFQNSTLCGLATNKNFFSHRQSNQKWLVYTVKNNIFVDCGKKGQTVRGMNGGQNGKNPTWTVDGNAFQFIVDGVITDSSADESTGDEAEPVQNSFEGVVTFADIANGDFSQKDTPAGDPRWIK